MFHCRVGGVAGEDFRLDFRVSEGFYFRIRRVSLSGSNFEAIRGNKKLSLRGQGEFFLYS